MSTSAKPPDQALQMSDELKEIHAGLSQHAKSISPKYFYDDVGSKLFDAICELPEYYPTRTELGIMQANIDEIAALIGEQASLIEFGSGSSTKTLILLEHLRDLAVYVPVDISREHLLAAADNIRADYPAIEILPVAADFTRPFQLPSPRVMPLRNIIYFPGSTIGNFSSEASLELLKVMHQEAGENGALLIGVDLQKRKTVLESAYNDSVGITAQFNLNVLRRLNREFGGTFDLDGFRHRAIYNKTAGRIEMYLDSVRDQVAEVGGKSFEFIEGEPINTEHSHKYTLEGFAGLAQAAGFQVAKVWMDPEQLFSVQYCVRD
jgi:L-histidine N-alpha-methyltransferase